MLTTEEKMVFLKEMRLFDDASVSDMSNIADVVHEVYFSDGDAIIVEGDVGDSLYFVVHGKVTVRRSGMEFQLGPKDCIGEMAMIDDQPRSASVISIGDTTLLRIDRDDFHRIIQSNVRLLRSFLKVVVEKLRTSSVREDYTMKEVIKAGVIQMSILPKPDFLFSTEGKPALEVSSTYYPHPGEKVSGDYYDYFPLSDHQMGIVIGDVMGHGTHAGMIVCIAKGCLHTQIMSDYSIPKVMSSLNEIVYRFIYTGLSDQDDLIPPYMNFCYFIIDLQSHTVSYSNAGHNVPQYHYCAETENINTLETHAFSLGRFVDMEYEVSELRWEKGDILVLYTDGIVDAENKEEMPYGSNRLEALIKQNTHLSAEGIKNTILEEVDRHCQGTYGDDRSLIIVKML